MSTERRWDQRRFRLEESTTQNNGRRTIFIEHMTPGTAVPPHYHNRFSETFDLVKGSVSVYTCNEPDLQALELSVQELEVGRKITIPPKQYHQYKVGDSEENTLRCIIEPGDADFERLLMILNGLGNDGKLQELSDSVLLMAVIMGLSDAHLIGPAKQMLDTVREEKREQIAHLKDELLQKYDNEESLRALLATDS